MKKRYSIWIFLISCLSIFLVVGCSAQKSISNSLEQIEQSVQHSDLKDNSSERIAVDFVRHVDGDTSVFLVNGKEQKVRFLLIDTSETVKPNTKVQPFGLEASKRTKELLSTASEITFEYDKGDRTDRYGRTLGYIFVDGMLLQETLVREGLARVAYVKEPNTKYLEELEKAQEEAKNESLGIWSISGYVTDKGFK